MLLRTIGLVFIVIASIGIRSKAADWRQFRGPGGQGASTDRDLPLTWNDQQNVLWKTELPGCGASSPIALGDRIYVTCYSGYGSETESPGTMADLKLHVVCLSNSGKMIWNQVVSPNLPETERVRDHGYAAPTPVTDGQHLYVFFGKTGVLKFDLDGKQLWQTNVGDKLHGWGCGTSPVLFQNLVIVNASVESNSLVAIHQDDGKEVWRVRGMDSSWNTPHLVEALDGKTELVVSIKGKILAFDPSTGKQLWSCNGIPDYVCPSVVSHQGVVYVIGGRTSQAIAVKTGGRGDVTETHVLWNAKAGANVVSPVVHDGYLYWVSDRNNIAYCVRLQDGHVMYAERFPAQPYASAVVGDGKIYIVTRGSGTYVLAAKPEFELLAHNNLDDRSTFNASPIIADSKLILRSNKFLYCIGK
jgi:outer membrane protein assembly factor BamB